MLAASLLLITAVIVQCQNRVFRFTLESTTLQSFFLSPKFKECKTVARAFPVNVHPNFLSPLHSGSDLERDSHLQKAYTRCLEYSCYFFRAVVELFSCRTDVSLASCERRSDTGYRSLPENMNQSRPRTARQQG